VIARLGILNRTSAMQYAGRIYRPPSEGDSLILQLTVGCSHNRCAFCAMYRDKRFGVRPLADVFADIEEAATLYPETRRVFICDGDALAAGYDAFASVCDQLNRRLPALRRIAAYVNARDVLSLSLEQRRSLRDLRFSLGSLGLESGSARVLERIHKGATPQDMIDAVREAWASDIKISVIALLGIGGVALSPEHVVETARVINEMQPRLLSFLTTIILPRTPIWRWMEQGDFQPLTERQTIQELCGILDRLDLQSTIVRANHRSNLLPLEGRLPRDKAALLAMLQRAAALAPDEISCVWTESEGRFL